MILDNIKIITPVDTEGFPCTTRDPDYAKTVNMDLENWLGWAELGRTVSDKKISHQTIFQGAYQDWISGSFVYTVEDYDYETAVELWRYRCTTTFNFVGVQLGLTIYIHHEEMKQVSVENDKCCIRDHQAEAEEKYFREQVELIAA